MKSDKGVDMNHLWQFFCDSMYDWVHLSDDYGQKTFSGWWRTRCYEWKHHVRG